MSIRSGLAEAKREKKAATQQPPVPTVPIPENPVSRLAPGETPAIQPISEDCQPGDENHKPQIMLDVPNRKPKVPSWSPQAVHHLGTNSRDANQSGSFIENKDTTIKEPFVQPLATPSSNATFRRETFVHPNGDPSFISSTPADKLNPMNMKENISVIHKSNEKDKARSSKELNFNEFAAPQAPVQSRQAAVDEAVQVLRRETFVPQERPQSPIIRRETYVASEMTILAPTAKPSALSKNAISELIQDYLDFDDSLNKGNTSNTVIASPSKVESVPKTPVVANALPDKTPEQSPVAQANVPVTPEQMAEASLLIENFSMTASASGTVADNKTRKSTSSNASVEEPTVVKIANNSTRDMSISKFMYKHSLQEEDIILAGSPDQNVKEDPSNSNSAALSVSLLVQNFLDDSVESEEVQNASKETYVLETPDCIIESKEVTREDEEKNRKAEEEQKVQDTCQEVVTSLLETVEEMKSQALQTPHEVSDGKMLTTITEESEVKMSTSTETYTVEQPNHADVEDHLAVPSDAMPTIQEEEGVVNVNVADSLMVEVGDLANETRNISQVPEICVSKPREDGDADSSGEDEMSTSKDTYVVATSPGRCQQIEPEGRSISPIEPKGRDSVPVTIPTTAVKGQGLPSACKSDVIHSTPHIGMKNTSPTSSATKPMQGFMSISISPPNPKNKQDTGKSTSTPFNTKTFTRPKGSGGARIVKPVARSPSLSPENPSLVRKQPSPASQKSKFSTMTISSAKKTVQRPAPTPPAKESKAGYTTMSISPPSKVMNETKTMAKPQPVRKPVSAATLKSRRSLAPAKASNNLHRQTLIKPLRNGGNIRHPNPFAARNMYYDERWMMKQESGFKRWLNFVLTSTDFEGALNESKYDVGKLWKACTTDVRVPRAPTKEVLSMRAYSARREMNKLRREALRLWLSPTVFKVVAKIEIEIEKRKLMVRTDKSINKDSGMKKSLLQLLLSYQPIWLRIGLETVYSEMIPGSGDVVTLSQFIVTRLLASPDIQAEFAHPSVPHSYREGYEDSLKQFTLKKFLQVVFFLDQAKTHRIIRHDPCLFVKTAKTKVSQL